ncbi:MAG: glycosyltransferase, partial [Ktedonobacterales bacterium]
MSTREAASNRSSQTGDQKQPAVLFLTNQFLPRVGGAEVLTLREAAALRALGHRMRIVTLRLERDWPANEEREGVPVRRTGGMFIGRKLRLRFGAQWLAELHLFRELVRSRTSYDLIHMRQVSFLARPVALAALLTRKPVLVQIANAGPGRDAPVPAGAETTLYAGALDPTAPYLRVAAGSWGASDIDTLRHSQWLAGLTLRLLRRHNATFLSVSERTTAHLI